MAGTTRSSFAGGIVFLVLTLICVILAFVSLPTGGEATCDPTADMTSPVDLIFGMISGYLSTILFAILAIIFGLRCYKYMQKGYYLWQGRKYGPGFKFGIKHAIVLIIFILAFMPFILPFIDHGLNTKDHSIYNPHWNGCSQLRGLLNTSSSTGGLDYNVQGIESTLTTTLRNNDTYKILVLLGPNRLYSMVTEMPFFLDFLKTGGSILICDDKGSTNGFVMEMAMLSQFTTPFVEFPRGDLADNASFIPGKDPHFPIIKNFEATHPTANTPWDINEEINEGKLGVALNHASAILPFGKILAMLMNSSDEEASEVNVVGKTTADYSYMDMNNDYQYDPEVDKWDPSTVVDFLMGAMCFLTEEEKQQLIDYASAMILGYLPKTAFAANDLPNGRLFLAADASFLNNQLLDDTRFSNAHFAENIFSWLSNGNSPNNVTIYFDEFHIKQEGVEEFSSTYIYGLFIGYINWISSSAILAWIYPFVALSTLSKWLPKDPEKLAKKKEKAEAKKKNAEKAGTFHIKFGSETAFVKKIKSLREGSDFNEPILMLYRRVLRRLNRLLGDQEPTPDRIISLIKRASKKQITTKDDTRLRQFFDTMTELKLKSGRRIETEEEFKNLFFEMTWVAEWLNINVI